MSNKSPFKFLCAFMGFSYFRLGFGKSQGCHKRISRFFSMSAPSLAPVLFSYKRTWLSVKTETLISEQTQQWEKDGNTLRVRSWEQSSKENYSLLAQNICLNMVRDFPKEASLQKMPPCTDGGESRGLRSLTLDYKMLLLGHAHLHMFSISVCMFS